MWAGTHSCASVILGLHSTTCDGWLMCYMQDAFLTRLGYSVIHFPNHHAWTSSLQNIPSAGGYAIDRLHKTLLPANAGSASYLASPLLPVFVRAPLEKQKSDSRTGLIFGSFLALFGVLTAPIGRVKLLIQCQDEMIKSGRLPKPYKGIVNCFARTISNEGFISLWRGYIPGVISDVSFRVNFQQFFLL